MLKVGIHTNPHYVLVSVQVRILFLNDCVNMHKKCFIN
jgi:hypothetical protein